jgi:hypothetical protein
MLGLDSSKANSVNSEALIIHSMSGWNSSSIPETTMVNELVRCSVSYRNVFCSKYAKFRLSQQPHIQKQVPISALGHLHGLTEYTLDWLLNAITCLEKRFSPYGARIGKIVAYIDVLAQSCDNHFTVEVCYTAFIFLIFKFII